MECWLKSNCKQLHCNDENGCMIQFKLNYLYEQANIPVNLRKYLELRIDSDGTDYDEFVQLKKIQDTITDFVENGKQLYIHSSVAGNGKSSWSLRLMQTYFNKIWFKTDLRCRGLFINVPYYLTMLKNSFTDNNSYIEHVKENLQNADLVIWDDIGTKINATAFEADTLLAMIESRIIAGKANIFTSNLNNEELRQSLGDRLASRITNLGYNIELHGGDKRGTN